MLGWLAAIFIIAWVAGECWPTTPRQAPLRTASIHKLFSTTGKLLVLLCLLTASCAPVEARPPGPLRPGVVGPAHNVLDADAIRCYRAVWGEWLRENPYKPRPPAQEIRSMGSNPWVVMAHPL